MKTFVSILISFVSVLACCFVMQCNAVKASAANDFSVSVTKISATEVAGTRAGDYRVTVYIDNANSGGLSVVAYDLYYDTANFTPLTDSDDFLLYTCGSEIINSMHVTQPNGSNYVTCAFASTSVTTNLYPDGELFSVYFRPVNNSTDITPVTGINVRIVQTRVNKQTENLSSQVSEFCEITAPMQYKVGDVDVDGRITSSDGIYISRVIGNANGTVVTASNYQNFLPAYEEGDMVCSFDALDVNNDGILTDADKNYILSYLAGLSPADPLTVYTTAYCVIDTTF